MFTRGTVHEPTTFTNTADDNGLGRGQLGLINLEGGGNPTNPLKDNILTVQLVSHNVPDSVFFFFLFKGVMPQSVGTETKS